VLVVALTSPYTSSNSSRGSVVFASKPRCPRVKADLSTESIIGNGTYFPYQLVQLLFCSSFRQDYVTVSLQVTPKGDECRVEFFSEVHEKVAINGLV
jgi:hypothetical protein